MKFIKRYLLPAIAITFFISNTGYGSEELAQQNNCLACHSVEDKLIGPTFKEIAAKYKDDTSAKDTLADKIKNGGSGVWGQIPMPPNPAVDDNDVNTLVDWILSL